MKRTPAISILLFCFTVCLLSRGHAQTQSVADGGNGEDRYWIEPMQKVHTRFKGRPGTFAHFGDSITVTLAFWTPLQYGRKNASPEMEKAYQLVKAYLRPECWRDWKGPQFGNEGSRTIRWAHENVDSWLQKLNPQVALIMFGTNDLHALELEEYRSKMREVVQKCLDNGTVVILTTIPPRHGFEEKAARYAAAVRAISREMKAPLIDYHAAILQRRPDDWDGAADKFREFKGYDVPTLISRDGVHPSNPQQYQDDYSPTGLSHNGFALRSYLTLMEYAHVLQALNLTAPTAAKVSVP